MQIISSISDGLGGSNNIARSFVFSVFTSFQTNLLDLWSLPVQKFNFILLESKNNLNSWLVKQCGRSTNNFNGLAQFISTSSFGSERSDNFQTEMLRNNNFIDLIPVSYIGWNFTVVNDLYSYGWSPDVLAKIVSPNVLNEFWVRYSSSHFSTQKELLTFHSYTKTLRFIKVFSWLWKCPTTIVEVRSWWWKFSLDGGSSIFDCTLPRSVLNEGKKLEFSLVGKG